MKADFDHFERQYDRINILFAVGYGAALLIVFPLMILFFGLIPALVVLTAAVIALTTIYIIIRNRKCSITADERELTLSVGAGVREIPLSEITAAGYNAELVHGRFSDMYVLRAEIRLASGERLKLEKWLALPSGFRKEIHSEVSSFVDGQPLAQLCRYVNRQVLDISDEDIERS